jgi:histidinol-phosphate aminotransferase
VSRTPESFVRGTIQPLAAYGPPRNPAPVALHLNEAPFDLPQPLKIELTKLLLAADWSKYPITDGTKLAEDLAKSYAVEPAGILAGNGSNELLQLLLLACIEPGDTVVIGTPSFSLYKLQAQALGARVVEVRLRGADGSFRFPIGELSRASQNAKLLLLGSPNNPTGTQLATEQVSQLLQDVPCLVGIDEAYRDFCGQDLAPLMKAHPRLVLFRTFSKAMAAASLRVGCMMAAPALCAELRKVQLPYNLSTPSCLVARELLKRPELIKERTQLIVKERERVAEELRELEVFVHPSGANFLLFEQERRPAGELHAALFKRGVLIRNVSSGEDLHNALRVSIGAPEKNSVFLSAMRAEL